MDDKEEVAKTDKLLDDAEALLEEDVSGYSEYSGEERPPGFEMEFTDWLSKFGVGDKSRPKRDAAVANDKDWSEAIEPR